MQLNRPTAEEAALIGDRMHISLTGARLPEGAAIVDQLATQGATAFDLSMLLRTLSRGQAFDVISSQVERWPTPLRRRTEFPRHGSPKCYPTDAAPLYLTRT